MNLQEILGFFNTPLKEDQVWALGYKCAAKLLKEDYYSEGNTESQCKYFLSPNGLKSVVFTHCGNIEFDGIHVQSETEVMQKLLCFMQNMYWLGCFFYKKICILTVTFVDICFCLR